MLVARGAQEKAKELEISVSISIVDDAGRLILLMRGDDTGYLTTETSQGKARAAAAFRRSTKSIVEENASGNSLFWQSLAGFSAELLPSTGAVPIIEDGEYIGAIGCGGGTAEQDHLCAESGAQKLKCLKPEFAVCQ